MSSSATSDRDGTWATVLAGGEGVRLRPLVRRLYGEDRPKQFASLLGSRSMLRQTLDRVRLAISPDRTVVVTNERHERYLDEALDGAPVRAILAQPEDRGTAAGVMLPVYMIHAREPDAVVAVFPSDQFVREDDVFMGHLEAAAEAVRAHPEWLVLLGATPTDADPGYGWIEPGEVLAWNSAADPISRVHQFYEKPSHRAASVCFEKGWLWNTFVFVVTTTTLIELAKRFLPRVHEQLARLTPAEDLAPEPVCLRRAYAALDRASFSRAVLELWPPCVMVSRLPRITWSDWGTPERVVRSLKTAGLLPSWYEPSEWSMETAS